MGIDANSLFNTYLTVVSNAQRVVYSTCSLFEEENEQVVEFVLQEMGHIWELHKALPNWKHRGLAKYEVGDSCIRASPTEDETNGFFVARFHRKQGVMQEPNAHEGDLVDTNTSTKEDSAVVLTGKKRKNTQKLPKCTKKQK